jgi:hypothetical protein
MHIRPILAVLAALAPACAPASDRPATTPTTAPVAAARAPRVVVLVVVDQLASWWFDARRDQLSGGMARLLREGVYYPAAEYPYAVTFTAAGHAAIGTGAPPALTGIADNERYHPELDRELPAVDDATSPVFVLAGGAGSADQVTRLPGRSSAALRVDGIADVLERETQGRAHTVTISLKDRSAIFVGGRKPDLAVWYDDTQPAMVTSTRYVAEPPAWLRDLARRGQVAEYLDDAWTLLPGVDHAAVTGLIDPGPGEYDVEGSFDDQFPHELAQVKNPARDLGATPAGDLLVFDTARAALDAVPLGADDVPDLLAVSFSAQDVVGHYWGPDSWERLDIFLRFDRELGAFLDQLDQRFGAQGYALVLTSDHGIAPLVEVSRQRGRAAHRLLRRDIQAMAEAAMDDMLGPGAAPWIEFVSDNSLFIAPELDRHPRRAEALDALVQRLRAVDGVQYAEQTERLRGNCESRQGMERLACFSVVPENPGHIYFAPASGSIVTRHPSGTNHGSPNDDDRHVPVLIRAPGDPRWATPRTATEPVTILQVAPTLAALLGVPAPPAATAPALP